MTDRSINVEFIRMFFRCEVEEAIAHRWAMRLAVVLGERVKNLRPETTLDELCRWAVACGVDTMDFAMVFEPELRGRMAEFVDSAEQTTFREMVTSYASLFAGND